MYYIIAIGVILIIIISFLKSPKGKGIVGEFFVNRILKKMALKHGGIELKDYMIEDDRSSSQIDNMLLTQKALYVIEVKNYRGYIFGNETSDKWTITVKHVNKKRGRNGKVYKKIHISKHQFYNPLKQNHTHINKIKNLTNIIEQIPIYNIVVFGRKASIKDVKHRPSVYVLHQHELKKLINQKENELNKILTVEEQVDIIDALNAINIKDRKSRKNHVKRIKQKYNK